MQRSVHVYIEVHKQMKYSHVQTVKMYTSFVNTHNQMPFRTHPLNATSIEPTLQAPVLTSNYFMDEMVVTDRLVLQGGTGETDYQDYQGETAMKDNQG